MKRILYFPRFTIISLALMLTAGVVVVSGIGCAKKAVYGTKPQQHKQQKKKGGMAPNMGG